MDDAATESFEEFKNSFSYGSRTDLSFKFLKRLGAEDAAEFIRLLIRNVGDLFDDASADGLIDLVYEWQVRAYKPKPGDKRPNVYGDRPFTPLANSLDDTTLALVTSSGHFVDGADPAPFGLAGMSQEQAIRRIDEFLRSAPVLTAIRKETPEHDLRVRHPGYDLRSVSRDPGVAFPMSILLEAENERRIGRLADEAYAFVGACAQGLIRREVNGWIDRWRSAGIEALFLVPV